MCFVAISISLEKCFIDFSSSFLLGWLLFFLLSCMGCLYILKIICNEGIIFSHSLGLMPILFNTHVPIFSPRVPFGFRTPSVLSANKLHNYSSNPVFSCQSQFPISYCLPVLSTKMSWNLRHVLLDFSLDSCVAHSSPPEVLIQKLPSQ